MTDGGNILATKRPLTGSRGVACASPEGLDIISTLDKAIQPDKSRTVSCGFGFGIRDFRGGWVWSDVRYLWLVCLNS